MTEQVRVMIERALDVATGTLQEIADAAGISYDTLWAWKTGRRNPTPENLQRLADVLEQRGREIEELSEEVRRAAAGDHGRTGKILITEERLRELQTDPLFLGILRLSRMVNSLRFAYVAAYQARGGQTPLRRRQAMNAFFLATAVMQETIDSLRQMSKDFRALASWQEFVVPILRDPTVKKLEEDSMRDLRRKVVFHFDTKPLAIGVRDISLPEILLAESRGSQKKDMYYPLADEAVARFLVPDADMDRETHLDVVKDWIHQTTALSGQLGDAIEEVILEGCIELGLRGHWEPDENDWQGPDDGLAEELEAES